MLLPLLASEIISETLESVMHGQCDTRPFVTFKAAGRHCL